MLVVLRCAGERTEALSLELLTQQFEDVLYLRMRPLGAAVRQGYRLAIAGGFRWLLTCDADILIHPRCAAAVARMRDTLPAGHWQGIARVDDKLKGEPRLGGLRLHRVEALADKIEHVSDTALRPEGDLCKADPRWTRFKDVLGRHDYEQSYADLYRKGAQHRRKHPQWLRYASRWRTSADLDLRAAWLGWSGRPAPTWPEKPPL